MHLKKRKYNEDVESLYQLVLIPIDLERKLRCPLWIDLSNLSKNYVRFIKWLFLSLHRSSVFIQNWANTCMGHKSPDLNVLAPYMIQFEFLMSPFVCLIFLESQTGRAYWYCLWYCASVRLGTFWLLIYDHMRQGTTAMVAFFQVGRSIRLNCHG